MRGTNMGRKCGAHMLGANVGHAVLGANVVLGTHVVLGTEHVTNQWDQLAQLKLQKVCTICTSARIPLKLINSLLIYSSYLTSLCKVFLFRHLLIYCIV